ncbi:MAG: DUF192 domain-containing protein [Candidatus Nanoarchaeia archaeon]
MKNKKSIMLIIVFLLLILFLIIIDNKQNTVCFGLDCFNVELARTSEEHLKGLMFREVLNSNEGMLFVFEKSGVYNFWMKDTLIPLDIIWMNSEKEVIFIYENALPCLEERCTTYGPNSESLYVLEVNAGTVDRINLSVGDKAILNFS